MWVTKDVIPLPEAEKLDGDVPVENRAAPEGLDVPTSGSVSMEKIALDEHPVDDVGTNPVPSFTTQVGEVTLALDSDASVVPPVAASTSALSVPSEPSFSDSVSSSQNDLPVSSAPVSVPDTFSALGYVPHHDLSAHREKQSADDSGLPDVQVLHSPSHTGGSTKSLEAVSAEPTLLNVDVVEVASPSENGGVPNVNGHVDDQETQPQTQVVDMDVTQVEFSEHPTSPPTSNTLLSTSSTSTFGESPPTTMALPDVKAGRTPSANRLSISYAGGNRRMVIDAEVVDSLKVFRQEGRIEVVMNIEKEADDGLKGILVCYHLFLLHRRIDFLCVAGRSFRRYQVVPSPSNTERSARI
jgi:20S proteasome subunit alpha 6